VTQNKHTIEKQWSKSDRYLVTVVYEMYRL